MASGGEFNVWQFLTGVIGGGFAGASLTWIKDWVSIRSQRRTVRLQEQVKLYAMLHFITQRQAVVQELRQKVEQSYKDAFEGKEPPSDPNSEARVDAEADETLKLINRYSGLVQPLNDEIFKLISENWHLIDSDDSPFFREFMTNHARWKVEFDEEGRWSVPRLIRRKIGVPFHFRSDFAERMKAKWEDKCLRLENLANFGFLQRNWNNLCEGARGVWHRISSSKKPTRRNTSRS
jgi:hypothetical protein